MLRLITKIPHKVTVAFSGGVDSLVLAHFLKSGKRDVTLAHFNHGCEYSDQIEQECRERAEELDCPIIVGTITDTEVPKGQSKEEHWRNERYKFLRSLDETVVMGHHLNDAIESWLFSSIHGNPDLIPAVNGNIIRPLLTTPKTEIETYAYRNKLVPVHDPFNDDLGLMRNYIRFNIVPHVYHVNPGIEKVIKKKYNKDSPTKE